MDNIESKIKHFIGNIEDFLSSVWSYITMLTISILAEDTTVLFSFLFTMLFLDYLTGIFAAWVESDGKHKVFFIESKRLRESGVKVAGYFVLIICSWFVTKYIYQHDISLFGIIEGFDLMELTLIMCASIEFFSNLENAKRAGFDVVGKIKSGAKKVHSVIKSIKGE